MKIYEAMNIHQLYSNQKWMTISEVMNTPCYQRSDKQQKLLIDSFTIELKVFQKQCDKISKQEK